MNGEVKLVRIDFFFIIEKKKRFSEPGSKAKRKRQRASYRYWGPYRGGRQEMQVDPKLAGSTQKHSESKTA